MEDTKITEAIKPEKTEKKQKIDKRKNLPQLFKKGKSGNPNGRPVGTISITEAIKRKLQEVFPDKDGTPNKEKRLYLDKLVESILKNALENGESRSQKDIWNYIDGFPKATIDIGADKDSLAVLTDYFRNIAKPKKKK